MRDRLVGREGKEIEFGTVPRLVISGFRQLFKQAIVVGRAPCPVRSVQHMLADTLVVRVVACEMLIIMRGRKCVGALRAVRCVLRGEGVPFVVGRHAPRSSHDSKGVVQAPLHVCGARKFGYG